MNRQLSFFALAVLGSTAALGASDGRIRTLAFNPDQIVRVLGRPGIQSTIEFAPDERIENVAVGDSSAWQITPNRRASLLFVKPLVPRSRTNMTVVTDRRTYMFDLVAAGKSAAAIYALKFSYPHEKAEEPQKPTQQFVAAAQEQAPSATVTAEKLHFDWKMKGTGKLQPSRIFDDGSSLYLVWAKDTPLPAILTMSEDRKEGPVNYRMSGEYIVISPIPSNIVLRYGSKYALVWPGHPIDQPVRSAPAPEESRMASTGAPFQAHTQQTVRSSPAAQTPHPAEPAPTNSTVKLANVTSLYSDTLTDRHHDR